MNYFRSFRNLVLCVALLVLPFLFLRAHVKDPAATNPVDRVILRISGPIQFGAKWLAEAVSGPLEDYVYLVDVKQDNDRLSAENGRLRNEVRRLRVEARRVRALEELLDVRGRFVGDSVGAEVIARDVSPAFRVVRLAISRGERDRVRVGMPVVAADGLVGEVRRVSDRYADVLLASDLGSRIDVVVGRTGARGRLQGLGDPAGYSCRIQFDRPDDAVELGDEIFTSGLGKKFPGGLLVGRVSAIDKHDYDLHQEGRVEPAVDFTRLNHVLVLTGQVDLAEAYPSSRGK